MNPHSFKNTLKAFSQDNDIPLDQLEIFANTTLNTLATVIKFKLIESSSTQKPFVIGINGAQGSGKSTLCALAQSFLRQELALHAEVLSMDDLYKTQAQRQKMADDQHPLFITRGVPGTHDIKLGLEARESLTTASVKTPALLPQFSKAKDDREDKKQWRRVTNVPDVLLLEGWCLGSQQQDEESLNEPVNQLENKEDFDGRWRKEINQYLTSSYQKLFALIDYLIFIQIPSFKCVLQWRSEQENQLRQQLKKQGKYAPGLMNTKELKRFIQHFERLTRHNLATMPKTANLIIKLDRNRTPEVIKPVD